jgi:hypothetical protein
MAEKSERIREEKFFCERVAVDPSDPRRDRVQADSRVAPLDGGDQVIEGTSAFAQAE